MKQIILILLFFTQSLITNAQCTCNYSYSGNTDTLYFNNLSVLSNAHYYWNFGDGSTSYSVNPTHIFPESGKYLVTLYGKDTLSGCHTYYETWIVVNKPTTDLCNSLISDSIVNYNGSNYLVISNLSNNCNSYYSNVDGGSAQNFPPGNYIWMSGGWGPMLLSNRIQFYSADSINGHVLKREYYKTRNYKSSSSNNYNPCSANFEYFVDYQVDSAKVYFKAMNQNAISYRYEVSGMGNPIYITTSNGACKYPYVSYEKHFPWIVALITQDAGGCIDTLTQIIYINNPNYRVPPNCSIYQQPQTQTVYTGNNAQFIISTNNGVHKQWQQDAGLGYVNLTNAGPYSGVNSDTLTISNIQITMNNYHYRCIVSESFSNCHNTSSEVILNSLVGIKEIDNKSLKIYPNPVSKTLIIENENQSLESSQIVITNFLGEIVLTTDFINRLDVSNIPSGVYFLKIKAKDNSIYNSKFVKEN